MTLTAIVQRVTRRRAALVAALEQLPAERLTTPAAAGGWSIRDVVEHLVVSEEVVLAGIAGIAEAPPLRGDGARPRVLRDRLRYRLVMLLLRSPIPIRVPSTSLAPRGARTFDELRSTWARGHEALVALARRIDAGEPDPPRFVHPVTGPMPLRDAVRMLEVHLARHERQIRRLLSG